ncbi:unnamed protein product [Rotaria sp. Silwood2]|nr:unnamed protein product [Rotaria sp. Silwood2]
MIRLEFQAPRKAQPALLPIFSGFIYISNDVDENVANIPYAGVVGDYKNARILVRNSSSDVVTGLLNSAGNYISSGENINLTASDASPIILVTSWASRLVFVDAISEKDNVPHDFNST